MTATTVSRDVSRTDVRAAAGVNDAMLAIGRILIAIIFVSSYLPELLAVCDSIAVMSRGRLREVRAASDWTEESIMTCAIASEI